MRERRGHGEGLERIIASQAATEGGVLPGECVWMPRTNCGFNVPRTGVRGRLEPHQTPDNGPPTTDRTPRVLNAGLSSVPLSSVVGQVVSGRRANYPASSPRPTAPCPLRRWHLHGGSSMRL